jgi:hypothetical protein
VPGVVLLGFVRTWLITFPVPLLAPVMPPVPATAFQLKLLGVLDVNVMLGLVPLQIVTVGELVIAAVGLTVTVMV